VGTASPVEAVAVGFDDNVLRQIASEIRSVKAEYGSRLPDDVIDALAAESVHRLAESRVPQFVPLFVGRFTRERIRELLTPH
jgi:hypothetical protein